MTGEPFPRRPGGDPPGLAAQLAVCFTVTLVATWGDALGAIRGTVSTVEFLTRVVVVFAVVLVAVRVVVLVWAGAAGGDDGDHTGEDPGAGPGAVGGPGTVGR